MQEKMSLKIFINTESKKSKQVNDCFFLQIVVILL